MKKHVMYIHTIGHPEVAGGSGGGGGRWWWWWRVVMVVVVVGGGDHTGNHGSALSQYRYISSTRT